MKPQVYDNSQTWLWNLRHAPSVFHSQNVNCILETPDVDSNSWLWCGLPVASPLGIPAGPLLDRHWLLHYAALGFDVLVYKTVRSVARDCYALPNLVPVGCSALSSAGTTISATQKMQGSWAVSFGMPSQHPDIWRKDVAAARSGLEEGKVLVVSVVGTQDVTIADTAESLDKLAEDFALCAAWAMESGAHGVEANFSCPNVTTADGQLYQQPESAGVVAERIRRRIRNAPLVLKIGNVTTPDQARQLLSAVGPYINGLAMTNSISAHVADKDGALLFGGQVRGICGKAIRAASIAQTRMFRSIIDAHGLPLDLIGVGGISCANDVREYLQAGATSVGIATAAMIDPQIGTRIRGEFSA